MRKHLGISLLASFLVLLWFLGVQGNQRIMPRIDVEMSLTFSPEPELGEEFTVTLTFTPREEIPHANELDDAAEIRFGGVELVSGVPWWEGRWVKGKTETFQVVVKVTEPGHYRFTGAVYSCRSDPRLWRKLLGIRPEMAEISERVFRFHNNIYHTLCIGKPELQTGKEIWSIDASTGEAKRIRVDEPPVPPSLLPEKAIVRDAEKPWGELEGIDQPEDTMDVIEYGFRTGDATQWVKEEKAYLLGSVKLKKRKPVLVFLYDTESEEIIQADFELSGDCCRLRQSADGRAEVILLDDRCSCSIVAIHAGVRYLIKVICHQEKQGKSRSSTNFHYIDGTFRYVDDWEDTLGMRSMFVGCYYCESLVRVGIGFFPIWGILVTRTRMVREFPNQLCFLRSERNS